ncbi:MAG: hypothetical protein MJZ34_13320 [Paludibacteraceae bacterium]|nr:hypothetical protein [Paludibacteraceae bacterium]
MVESPTEYYNNCYTDDSDYDNLEERLTIEGHESGAADYFGEYKRTNHSHGGTFRYYGGTHPQESNDIYEDFSGPSIDRGRGSTNQTEIKLKTRE